MYASELTVENPSGEAKHFVVRRRESDPSLIKSIRIGAQPIPSNISEGNIIFEIELQPRNSATVRVQFHDLHQSQASKRDLLYEIRTLLRRRLCEVRDNYFMKYSPGFVSQLFKVN